MSYQAEQGRSDYTSALARALIAYRAITGTASALPFYRLWSTNRWASVRATTPLISPTVPKNGQVDLAAVDLPGLTLWAQAGGRAVR